MTAYVSVEQIDQFFMAALSVHGVSAAPANSLRMALINASLFGIDSHGVNLFSHYIDSIRSGRVRGGSDIEIFDDFGFITCNSNNNFSHYAASELLRVMDDATSERAISIGRIINSDHIGAVGIHAYNSGIQEKLIIGFTNADALANTPDGKSIVFGTNPLSLVVNSSDNLLFVDLATTVFSMNKVKNYRRLRMPLPSGVARDQNMQLTVDPEFAKSLEPIGAHKGFALAFLVEIMTSGLSGQPHSADIVPMYGGDLSVRRNISHTFIMINPGLLGGDGLPSVWETVKRTRYLLEPRQRISSPGCKELQTARLRRIDGIPVDPEILSGWRDLGFKA